MERMILIVSIFFGGALANPFNGLFTPLKNDEHPCVAENLKESFRYLCNDKAEVICLAGWDWPENPAEHDLRNPCPVPICLYNGETCKHGECVRPGVCACEVGWEGHLCDKCVPLPGCDHGSCKNAFECNCNLDQKTKEPLYEGAFCDRPACKNCDAKHGQCFEPNVCTCHDGWTGIDCRTCIRLPGCVNGDCDDGKPNTCKCRKGWKGALCDEPICREGCSVNGYCEKPDDCVCKTGWKGEICEECVPYWTCPAGGTCNEPNQCICDQAAKNNDVSGVCNRVAINGPEHGPFSECSNKCKKFEDVSEPGTKVSKCRWSEGGDCEIIEQECYGQKEWTIVEEGDHDHPNCIHVIEKSEESEEETTSTTTTTTTTTAAQDGGFVVENGPPPTQNEVDEVENQINNLEEQASK